jgi:hypothetical protein
MSTKRTVFGSKSERDNYYKLCRTWGDKYHIFHNLPFLNVFDRSNLIEILQTPPFFAPLELTDTEFNRLKKTSIDFTLCDMNDNPILCIEFDGMQQGINVGYNYFPDPNNPLPQDQWRKAITELKIKVALGSMFPFFVVGSEQFRDITPEIKLTIIDGIIGSVLAKIAFTKTISRGFKPEAVGYSPDAFADLPDCLQQELIQDWVWGIEAETELENDPLDRLRWSTEREGIGDSYRTEYLTYPNLDHLTIQDRARALDNVHLHGCRVTLHTPEFGDIAATAWVPNFKTIHFSGLTIAENIAYILAKENLRRKRMAKGNVKTT